jgi:SAM-dependent methyltransferase
MTEAAEQVDAHYGRPELERLILNGLQAEGKDLNHISADDLAPVDQFHIRGKEATLELARRAGLERNTRVLDVGGGLGGPARTLASELGCLVTVLDLTEEFVRLGRVLTERCGLSDRVSFQHGNAQSMPLEDGAFDAVWTQHACMNIPDKQQLYAEIRRVLRPGGTFATHEILAGPEQPIHFPVPWAPGPEISFLQSAPDARAAIANAGFTEREWVDMSEPSMAWFRERVGPPGAPPTAPPHLGLHLLLGPQAGMIFGNVLRNLEEQRLTVVQGVFQ